MGKSAANWIEAIHSGSLDNTFAYLYGESETSILSQRERYIGLVENFVKNYGEAEEIFLFSAPGRTEVGGNHTDHNKGKVLAAGVDMDIIAAVTKTDEAVVRLLSKGHDEAVVTFDTFDPIPSETNTSPSLIRGILAGFVANGKTIGGFKAYTESNVLRGSGLSSSAAFEILVGVMVDHLYNDGDTDPVTLAKIGQLAENKYFGKACGLLDQMTCAHGGFIAVDFADTENLKATRLTFDPESRGYALCIVDTGGSHADLSDEYSAIPAEMKSVAALFGKEVLREVGEETFRKAIPSIKGKVSDRAILRALHFFAENRRVEEEEAALAAGDMDAFLAAVIASGNSSYRYLQNVYASKAPHNQEMSLALCLAEDLLAGKGAWRVHGGGFAGTIQCYLPLTEKESFRKAMEEVFGQGSCHFVRIRPCGGIKLEV